MPLTTAGLTSVAAIVIGGGTRYTNTNAHLGVGDSTTAFSAAHTNLQAATNKMRRIVDLPPTNTVNVETFVTTFGASDANWSWQEFGIFNHASAGDMLIRKVQSSITKASPVVVELTIQLTWLICS